MTHMIVPTTSARNSCIIGAVMDAVKQLTETETLIQSLINNKTLLIKQSHGGMLFYVSLSLSKDLKVIHVSVKYYPPSKKNINGTTVYVALHKDHADKIFDVCGKTLILIRKDCGIAYRKLMTAVEYRIHQNFLEEQFG